MEPTPPPSGRENSGGSLVLPRRGHVLALLVLIGAVVFVIASWRVAYQRELRAAQDEFVGRTTEVADLLRQRMVNYELLTRGGAALFASVQRPTPQQWYDYVEGMGIHYRFPDVVGFGFAGYVRRERVGALQAEWRDAGYGALRVRPQTRKEYQGPILYLEPKTTGNVRAIGFDMYSEPARSAAMQLALETGEAQLSGPVQLIQDDLPESDTPGDETAQAADGGSGLLLVLPVYRGGETPATAEQRRQSMQGWVYVPFRMGGFIAEALQGDYPNLRFSVSDITDGAARQRLYDNTADGQADAEPPAFTHGIDIEHYGRRWRLQFQSAPLATAAPRVEDLRLNLALGLFAALLMYAVAWTLAHVEARAHRIALRMTEDYRRSELRFRTAMEHSAIGTALLDSDGCIVEANPALGMIVGQPAQALAGQRFESLFEDEDDTPSTPDRGHDGVYRVTRRLHHAGGVPHHTQLTYAPVPGNVGQDISGLVQAEDVTERLRAQARVHALNRTLEARVALRTRELSQANQELEAFAYSVSHDLRAPLRAIDGFSRILVERYGPELDEGGQGYLSRVRKAAARMGELIDALLKMSRVARSELRPEPVDLSRMAAEVVEELVAGEREHDREVDVEIEPDLHAQGDAVLLRNLLSNLLGNAWKFTRGRDRPGIVFGCRQGADGEREYFVRDNGVGFSQEYVDKLFRPFQRLHGEEHFAGHGIGLASVKRIVERHGGTIRAEGREGEGATFYFTLPGVDTH